MSAKTTQDSIIRDLERLDLATTSNAASLVGFESDQAELKAALEAIKTLKARQEELVAQKQEITQEFNASLERGKEAASSLRSLVRGRIGRRSELLVQFRMPPIRRGGKRGVTKKKGAAGGPAGVQPVVPEPPTDPAAA